MGSRRPPPTHDQVVEAALCCFVRDGYADTQMRAVAKEAGTSVGQLYVSFPSKRALFTAVAAHGNKLLVDQYMLPAAMSTAVPFDRALAVAEAYFQFYIDERELSKLMVAAGLDGGMGDDRGAADLVRAQQEQFARMEEIVGQLELDPVFEPVRVMRWCWAALFGLLALNLRLPHLSVDDDELDRIIGTGMRMLRVIVREAREPV